MDKHAIIKLKLAGHSNRKAAKMLHINRKTVAKYWNEYKEQTELLDAKGANTKTIQETICTEPIYDASGRKPRKYIKEMDQFLDEILESEQEKCKLLGTNKQKLTQVQIYELFKQK